MICGKKRCGNRKGQITIFIIIGIIMLLSIALIIYLRSETSIFRPRQPSIIPSEAEPIKNYVEACIEKLGAEAADIIGTTGGYVEIPEELVKDRASYLEFSPLETGKNPYWYYGGQRRIPSLDFISRQIDRYIDENLLECISKLDIFREQYIIEERGQITSTTKLADEGILLSVAYPITISDKLGVKITDINEFNTDIPYRLKKAYELAVEIMEREESQAKLEDLTIDLIALDTDIPYSNIEIRCDKRRWKVSEIKEKLKTLLRYNLPLIKVSRTDYTDFSNDMPYMKNHYVWDVTEVKYRNFKVGFTYDDRWPIDFYVRPSKGDYIESGMQKGAQIVSWLCLQIWKFTYDVKYPVLVTVADEKTGYAFSFSFRVIVDHNQADRTAFGTSTFEFEPLATESEYCSDKTTPMTIASFDDVNGDHEPIAGVDISFTCLRYTCSDIGTTEFRYGGAEAVLNAEIPYCSWGILRGEKEGYETGETFLSTETSGKTSVYLVPLTRITDYEVVKHKAEFTGNEWVVSESAENLKGDESAAIYIEKDDYSTSGSYPAEDSMPLVFLSDGTFDYVLRLYILYGDSIKGVYLGSWTVEQYEM
ncbi:hypothetical protein KY317_01270, partial [Candidatus Woesearchaeota archaeon]|nr:hypothetical protein [Candidatus Woesearchaeota archaeon]